LLALGLGVTAWVAVTLIWGEPFTSLYTRHEQQALSRRLESVDRQWRARTRVSREAKRTQPATRAETRRLSEAERALRAARLATAMNLGARRFRGGLEDGQPIGRIIVPGLGLNMVVVEGTSEADLEKGPGHYNAASGVNTALPGMGGVVAIAGHRTTYLHPFRHIDDLQPGDDIYLRMPYGIFGYRVYMHRIVGSTDWSILHQPNFEKLVLSACHPLYSATHRFAVFARLHSERYVPGTAGSESS
jgi:sortase A